MSDFNVIVKAPGKIILHGEHAVVYGKRAIACAIDGNITVELKNNVNDGLTISMQNLESSIKIQQHDLKQLYQDLTSNNKSNNEYFEFQNQVRQFIEGQHYSTNLLMQVAISACVYGYLKVVIHDKNLKFPSLSITAVSDKLPLGAGLGSSAALNVALSTSLLIFAESISVSNVNDQNEQTLNEINSVAYSMEKVVHGTPSGIDNTVSTYGGAVVYKNKEMRKLPNFAKLNILIVDTGVSRNTKELVLKVKKKYNKEKELMSKLMEDFENISNKAESILSTEYNSNSNVKYIDLKKLINKNHELLKQIGVSHSSLEQIKECSTKLGFGCKLTGAGGGGCAIILLDNNQEKILELKTELKQMGFNNWEANLGGNGVKVIEYNGIRL